MKLTRLTARMFYLARKAKLPNPLGRAFALMNRRYNDGIYNIGDPLKYMKRIKSSTASRWLKHMRNGGCLKSLERTVEQEKKFRKEAGERNRLYLENQAIVRAGGSLG